MCPTKTTGCARLYADIYTDVQRRIRHSAGMHSHTRERATRENTIKAAPGKNTNLNGTKEICSHIRCIRMNGARLLQFTIYCIATFFSADASGIRSLLPVLSLPRPPPVSPVPLSRSRSFSLSGVTGYEAEETKRESRGRGERESESEDGRTGLAGQNDPGGKAVIAKKDNARED